VLRRNDVQLKRRVVPATAAHFVTPIVHSRETAAGLTRFNSDKSSFQLWEAPGPLKAAAMDRVGMHRYRQYWMVAPFGQVWPSSVCAIQCKSPNLDFIRGGQNAPKENPTTGLISRTHLRQSPDCLW